MIDFARADSARLTSRHYDVLIIGGGINGVAIARDAAQRGLSTALIEKCDFAVGTSSWNSRLIHGGLRYLEHGELPLVYESLHDRESLLRIAPHLVEPLGFVVPFYSHNHLPGWMFHVGMMLYDALSIGKSLPVHRRLGRKQLATELPGLNKTKLSGAAHYYDGQIAFPERLVLETALSAHQYGADISNYVEAVEVLGGPAGVKGVTARDTLSGETFDIAASCVVNAAGPWVDQLDAPHGIDRQIGGTTGTHIIVDPFPGAPEACIYFEAKADNRPILVIPWNGRYLIGTTDDRFEGDAADVKGKPEELDYLITETNLLIPEANLQASDVLFSYTGVRPLPYRPGAKPGSIPRSHLILTHDNIPGLVTIVGGKLTPHISLGKQTVNKVAAVLGRPLPKSRTATAQLPGAYTDTWTAKPLAASRLKANLPWRGPMADRLVAVYGEMVSNIVRLHDSDERYREVFGEGRSAVTAAEIVHVLQAEGAVNLVDILHRRTMVGLEPALGTDVEREVATFAATVAGWDAARVEAEIAAHREYITRLQGGIPDPKVAGAEGQAQLTGPVQCA